MKYYSVYLITNNFNDKKYVGITSMMPKKRWAKGKGYTDNIHFNNAILKYGWENFDKQILYKGLTQEQAKNKEIELIKEYNSIKNGYNISAGGDLGVKHTEITKEKIRQASKKISKESRLSMAKKLSKNVYQYDLEGNFIKKFASTSIAGKELNISPAHISAVCNGKRKTANGFIFKYYKSKKIAKQHKKVIQLSLNGDFIHEFNSATVAAKELNLGRGTICAICNHHYQRKTSGGFKWMFSEEYYKKEI